MTGPPRPPRRISRLEMFANAFMLSLLVWAPLAIVRGFTVSVLWGWFMEPTFDLPSLGVLEAYGVVVTVGAIVPWGKSGDGGIETQLFNGILYPALALLTGFVVHFWMTH